MKTLTVLVAEDDLLTRMVLERSVVQWGYRLLSASDGGKAQELLQTHTIDICILDWNMPGLSGIEICKWLRAGNVKISPYVILITSREQPEDMQAAYEAGADDYLTKPCDMKYLRRRIATIAEKFARPEAGLEEATRELPQTSRFGLSPLDIYLADIRLMRRKP